MIPQLGFPHQLGPLSVERPPGALDIVTQYEILGELGRGAMGVVYKARQGNLNRFVAIKRILRGPLADLDEVLRFCTEVEAAARLRHPNIVQIFGYGSCAQDGMPSVIMEYVEGTPLDQRLGGVPQPISWSVEVTEMLAHAMHYAHSQDVIHRDLKPKNIVVALDGTPKITDFGLAKCLDNPTGLTQAGAILGTPCYMAPEQARGNSNKVDGRADVYSLGAILYEMLTGGPPIRGTNYWDTVRQVRSKKPVPAIPPRPDLPDGLSAICHKCLEKTPRKRYATAGELAEALRQFRTSAVP
jgi:eukaryotic-like serine/threonine-protein kinase